MAKKKHPEEHENHERWLVSYADFITLLFAFFTVLYALSQSQNKEDYDKAAEQIERSFVAGLGAGGFFLPFKGSMFSPFHGPTEIGSAVPTKLEGKGQYKEEKTSHRRLRSLINGLYERNTGLHLNPNSIDIATNPEGFKIRLGSRVLFNPGSEKLKKENLQFLYALGKRLTALKAPIQIEGHSDNRVVSENRSNWELSTARAYTVVRFFVEGVNFPENQISLAGYGDTRPVAKNDTPEGRARNRRVEIAILKPLDQSLKELGW